MKRMLASLRAVVVGAGLLAGFAGGAQAAVWEDTEDWNDAWEARFSEWVMQEWTRDTFHDPDDRLTFGLALDCADAVYVMRALFAYKHNLPFIINDPRNGKKYTNRVTTWDNYRETLREEQDDGSWTTYKGPVFDETQKVRAFLEFVSDITSTRTLVNDTYPVALSDLRPGDIFLVPNIHAYMIKEIDDAGAMTTLSASSPREWRQMAEVQNFPADLPKSKNKADGYRRFKPEAFLRTPGLKVPGASDEQWRIIKEVEGDWSAFAMTTQNALAKIKEPLDRKVQRLFETVCDYAIQRVDVVNVALDYLDRIQENNGRSCMTVGEYAEYSTPSRDAKLEGAFKTVKALMNDPDWEKDYFPLRAVIESVFNVSENPMSDDQLRAYCAIPVDIERGGVMNLRQLWRVIEKGKVASDPHAPLMYRWGFAQDTWTPQCKVAKGG